MSLEDLTQTERKVYNLLADGLPHAREEIHALLEDELSAMQAIKNHVSAVRKQVRKASYEIVFDQRTLTYRMVQIVHINGKETG